MPGRVSPALLTRIVRSPKCSAVARAAASKASLSRTSSRTASPPIVSATSASRVEVDVGHADRGAVAREPARDRLADPARAARHQRDAHRAGAFMRGASVIPAAASSSVIASRSLYFWIFVPDIGHSSTKRT